MANPWDNDPVVGRIPTARTPIYGVAPKVDPYKAEDQAFQRDQAALAQEAAQRAREDQALQRQKFEWEKAKKDAPAKDPKVTEGERASAGYYRRAMNAHLKYGEGILPRGRAAQSAIEILPDSWENSLSSPERREAQNYADEFIRAKLRKESGAAIPSDEMAREYRVYFPQPGDEPADLARKAGLRKEALEGLRIAAGSEANAALQGLADDKQSGGVGNTGRDNTIDPLMGQDPGGPPPLEVDIVGGRQPTPQEIAANPQRYEDWALLNERMANTNAGGAAVAGLADTVTLGGFDELSAGADAIGGALQGKGSIGDLYRRNVAGNREFQRQLQDRDPAAYFGGQVAGGIALPMFGAQGAAQLARVGGGYGALYGFGSGEGDPLERTPNALIGAATGAGVGYSVGRAVEAGAPAVRSWLGRNATDDQRALVAAADRRNVRLDASDLRPGLAGTVGFLESMPGSSGRIQRSVAGGRDDIERAITALADPDRAVSPQTAGAVIRRAGERMIAQTGQARDAAYRRAEQLDGGRTQVEPATALREFDSLLANLGQMGGTNRQVVNALAPLRGDLVQATPDGQEALRPITIDGLRQFRRGLRDALSNEGVVAGIDDAQLQPIIRAATDDLFRAIETNSGPEAAAAFRRADQINTARMTYIDETLKPFLGTLRKPTSPQQAFDQFRAAASNKGKGDGQRLLNLQRSLTPDERLTVNATIMAKAGRQSPDEPFSPALFVTSMRDISPAARRVMFGIPGARAVGDLVDLSIAKRATVGAFNASKSGKVSNFKDMISMAVLGTGGAMIPAVGSLGAAAVVGAAATVGGANLMARIITNPTFARALANAPPTTAPRAINNYMIRLRSIAARDPNLRGVVESLEQRMIAAANDNVAGRAAASDDEADRANR